MVAEKDLEIQMVPAELYKIAKYATPNYMKC